jgi:hypothetical protein
VPRVVAVIHAQKPLPIQRPGTIGWAPLPFYALDIG